MDVCMEKSEGFEVKGDCVCKLTLLYLAFCTRFVS